MRKHHRQLDASVGASGPHDFAVRISAARLATQTRPPQPAPTSVTWPTSPLLGTGWRYHAGDLPPGSSTNSVNRKVWSSDWAKGNSRGFRPWRWLTPFSEQDSPITPVICGQNQTDLLNSGYLESRGRPRRGTCALNAWRNAGRNSAHREVGHPRRPRRMSRAT